MKADLKCAGICFVTEYGGLNGIEPRQVDIGNYYRSVDSTDSNLYLLLSFEDAKKYYKHPDLQNVTVITKNE